jgi:integrase
MPRAELTPRFVRRASCPQGRQRIDFFDSRTTGFLLEVRPSGRKTYGLRYADPRGRKHQVKIGRADVLTLAQARKKARQVIADVVLGAEPHREREQIRATPTLSTFAREQYMPHVKSYKRSWITDDSLLRCRVLPALGPLGIDEVTPARVREYMQGLRDRGYANTTVNRIRSLLQHAFNLARKWKVPSAPTDNPVAELSALPETPRERYLSPDEVRRLMRALDDYHDRQPADAIKLLLLTGARRAEVTRATWDQVDFARGVLRVPISKSGRPRSVSLGDAALALLQSLKREVGSPLLFPSPRVQQHSLLHQHWDAIRRRAGLPDVRLHDLRHSFASMLVNSGESLYVVQDLLGHSSPRMTQRYAHVAPDTRRRAVDVVGRLVQEASAGLESEGEPPPAAEAEPVKQEP